MRTRWGLASALAAAMTTGLAGAALADSVTFDFTGSGGLQSRGASMSFSANGVPAGDEPFTVGAVVQAWSRSKTVSGSGESNDKFETAWLGQYDGGLGVINENEYGLSNFENPNEHTADNVGTDDLLSIDLNPEIENADRIRVTLSVYDVDLNFQYDPDADSNMWIGSGDGPANLAGLTLAQATAGMTQINASYDSTKSTFSFEMDFDPTIDFNRLLIGPSFSSYDQDDGWKLKTLKIEYVPIDDSTGDPVPEPASLALAGLGIIGLAVRRKSRRGK